MANTIYKPVQSLVSTRQEKNEIKDIYSSDLTYTLCNRVTGGTEANYFISFNLPHTESMLSTGSTLSLESPELQHLNVDEIVISPIGKDKYADIIDGRSISFTVPTTGLTSIKVVSSTYSQLTKHQDSALLGNNIAFLFSDDINKPRTGTTRGGVVSASPRDSWDVMPRPVAHAYSDLEPDDIFTDKRDWSTEVNPGVSGLTESYPTNNNQGYNYDIPVGFVALDKGFMVLTHPDIVNNIPWTGSTVDEHFSQSVSRLKFTSIEINFKTSVVCLALPGEFVFSTNPSWDLDKNLLELQNGTNGFDPIMVTEIGLYNKKNELIAVAKTSEPIEKSYTGLITFNLDIDV